MARADLQDEFKAVVMGELSALYRTARRILQDHDEAEDAVQETLDKAWRNLNRFDHGSRLKPWLFKILTNTCLDVLRVRLRHTHVAFDAHDQGFDDNQRLPDELQANRELGWQIENAISRLSSDYQTVVQLVIIEQFSYDEAAIALDVPVGTIRSRLSRARASLVAELSGALERRPGPQSGRPAARLRLIK